MALQFSRPVETLRIYGEGRPLINLFNDCMVVVINLCCSALCSAIEEAASMDIDVLERAVADEQAPAAAKKSRFAPRARAVRHCLPTHPFSLLLALFGMDWF